MDPLVRVSVLLQRLCTRLWGVVLAFALGVYLLVWAVDPLPVGWTYLAVGTAALSALTQTWIWLRGRQGVQETEAEMGLLATAVVAVYAAIWWTPGGLHGAYYPLIYVLVMVGAAYGRPSSLVLTVLFAGLLEFGLRMVALGERELLHFLPRWGFLVVFAGLNVVLFRAEIARVRAVSKKYWESELVRLREAARAYRLTGATEASQERALHSSVEEVRSAVQFSLELLRELLSVQSAALYVFDSGKRFTLHEVVGSSLLREEPVSAREGIFSVLLQRKQAMTWVGERARGQQSVYVAGARVGALALMPLIEEGQVRGLVLVDREEERDFSESELQALSHASEFILRSMQNERVFASLERASREQAQLYRAAQMLAAVTSEAEVIEIGVESAREMASFDFAAVTLFHKKTSSHEICAVSGEGAESLLGRKFRHNAGLVSMVVANRQALPYRGEYEPSRQTVFARGQEPPAMPSLLVLPLLVHERVLGTLVLGSHQRGAFSESVRPALEVLASHMAVSLANARMLKRLEEQATTDGMTGLLNKRALLIEAERRIKVSERFQRPLSVLVTDIDHFKKVNDTYGHDVGDVVIRGMGDVLRRIKRDTDIVGRFGGEEFVIVCEQTDQEGARNLAERIRRELEVTSFQTEMGPLQVTCSVGVATFPAAGTEWDALFKATDEALYVSKRSGRNRVTVWTPSMRNHSAA